VKLSPRDQKVSPKLTMGPPVRSSLAPKTPEPEAGLVQIVITMTPVGLFHVTRFSRTGVISTQDYARRDEALMHVEHGLEEIVAP